MSPDRAMDQCTALSRKYTDRNGVRHYGCKCPAIRYYGVDPSLSSAERSIVMTRISNTQHFGTLEKEHLISNFLSGNVLISRCKKHALWTEILDAYGLRPVTSAEALTYHILAL